MKKLLSFLLALLMLLSLIPVSAMAASPVPTEAQAYSAMMALKPDYPEGMRWTNANYYDWRGGIFSGGFGCAGFAFLLSDAAFGDLPARIIEDITIKDVHVGDILRVNGDSHSVIVTEVYASYVILAEGNYNSSIHWGRRMSASEVAASTYMMTRYPIGTFGPAYTITYDPNGGSDGPEAQIVDEKGSSVSSVSPQRRGYELLGWALSPTATKPDYVAGDAIKVTKDTTLYAVWKENIRRIEGPYPASYTAAVPAGGEAYYAITPTVGKTYVFESTGELDACATLYDASWNSLGYNDDGGENYNFRLSYALEAGATYYLAVKLWGSYQEAAVPFTVSEAAAPHVHSYAATVVPPSCTEMGYTVYTCACGDSYDCCYTDALGHDWDDGTETVFPTESSSGLMTYTCLRCGAEETSVIPPLGHRHDYAAVVTDPTCTEDGYTTYTCACGESYRGSYVRALGHDWDDGVVTLSPTETASGIMTYTCARCGAEETEVLPPLGSGDAWITCTTPVIDDFYYGSPIRIGSKISFRLPDGVCSYTLSCHSAIDNCFNFDVKWGDWVSGEDACLMDITVTGPAKGTLQIDLLDYYTEEVYASTQITVNVRPSNPFTDIGNLRQSFRDAILWAYQNDVAAGATATTYNPHGSCTRGQVVTFLWRAAGKPEPTTTSNPYNDVSSSAYYYKAILWAAENGITAGYNNPDGSKSFKPNDTVTRGQFVTFLWRYLGKPMPESTINPFDDVTPGGFYNAILWGSENGIVAGYNNPDGSMSFKPNNPCTRAHVAVFLYRAMA